MLYIERHGKRYISNAIQILESVIEYLKECETCMNDEKTTDINRYYIFSHASEKLAKLNVTEYAVKLASLAARIDETLNHITIKREGR